jgi:hypothetical protein
MNIYEGDFFEIKTKALFTIQNYDIIIGNPPYNPDVSKNNAKGQIIWPRFVLQSIDLLKDKGYLLFIHPPNWRKPKHEMHELMFNNIQFIKIMSEKESEKYFNCKIRVDYYLFQKNNINKNAKIIDELNNEHEINISKLPYIANYGLSIHNKLINSNIQKIICINPRTHDTTRNFVKKTQDKQHVFKLLNTISSKGETFYYSSKIHPAQHLKKVMFSNGRYIYPIYDDGTLGGTQSVLYIETIDKNEGINLINFINSELFKFIIKSTKFNNFAISHELISSIPNLAKNIKDINNTKIISYLKLTNDELNLISTSEK